MAKPTKTARKPKPKPVMHPISPMLANLMAADDLTETLIDTCTAVKARLDEHCGFGLPRPGPAEYWAVKGICNEFAAMGARIEDRKRRQKHFGKPIKTARA